MAAPEPAVAYIVVGAGSAGAAVATGCPQTRATRCLSLEHRRASLPPFSYEYYLYETGGNLLSALYQLTGPGRRRQRVVYDPRRIADIAGWLTGKLGPLANFEVVEQPIPSEAETASSADVSDPAPESVVEVELPEAATSQPARRAKKKGGRRALSISRSGPAPFPPDAR